MARNIIDLRFFRLVIWGVLLAVAMNPMGLYGNKTPCQRAKIVKDAIKRITASGIFPDDYGFLRRIAFVESKDGGDLHLNPNGGIWQLTTIGFADTKESANRPVLERELYDINKDLGIDWSTVEYADLENNPFLSALAARIFLSNIEPAIPNGIPEQAAYWKQYYNTPSGAGTVQKFIEDITCLEKRLYK